MPRPPRIKIKQPMVPFMVPEEIAEEMKEKDEYVQMRMPVDVWAKIRARQHDMEEDAKKALQKSKFGVDIGNLNIPMTEVMRKTFEVPLFIGNDDELMKMLHKRGKGRLFK